MRPKRLDIFILKSFLLLFVAAFAICLFVLLMNVLWRYAEDIVGKGLNFTFLAKFFCKVYHKDYYAMYPSERKN